MYDTIYGFWRGCVSRGAGINNDQSMLQTSPWNTADGLVAADEGLAADGGYASTEHIAVVTPASKTELLKDPPLVEFNEYFNADRGKIECAIGAIKRECKILMYPWRRRVELFPLCLRVCLKLMNRYWRLYGSLILPQN